MLRPPMSSKFILSIEAPSAIPVTARVEALEDAHDGEMLLEVAGQVAVTFEGLGAVFIGAAETRIPKCPFRYPVSMCS